jgi:hypothetical protein
VGSTLEQIGKGNDFLNRTQKAHHLREKNEQMGPHQNKEPWHSEGNCHQTQETVHGMGENFYQLLIQ